MRCNSTASINIVREMNRDVRIPRGNVFEGDGGRRVEGGEVAVYTRRTTSNVRTNQPDDLRFPTDGFARVRGSQSTHDFLN